MKHVHFIGIAGSGASACAAITHSFGYKVTGCDINPTEEFTRKLKDIQIQKGHNPSHLQGVDILAITPAISSLDPNNPELTEAKKRMIKILTWQKFLGKYLTKNKFVIAICGTHGKSTTTAMIGTILEDGKLDPTVILGANNPKWGSNFKVGTTRYFVVEADEFNDNYLSLTPDISVVTNIEFDHPEYFKNFESYKRSFQNFLLKTKNMIVANLEAPVVQEVLAFHLGSVRTESEKFFKPVVDYSKNLIDFPLKVIGEHNILNASAAYQVGIALGINSEKIKKALRNFQGISRRMEYLGKFNGAKVYSDFGHHPTEIKATLEALKQKYNGRRIFVFFEPHMFSRTKALFNDFVKTFRELPAAKAFIVDIYPSREIDTGLVSSRKLVDAIGNVNIKYAPDPSKIIHELTNQLISNNILIFMGAGDIDQLARELVD